MIQRRQIEYSNRTLRMWKWINCVCRKCSARQKCFASLSIFVCISSLYRSVCVSHHWRARILKCGPHSMPFSGFIIQLATAGPAVRAFRIGSVQVAISNNLKSSLSIFFSCLRESLTVSFPFLHAQQFRQFHALCVLPLFLSLFSSLLHIPANFAMPKAISCAGRLCAQL